MAENERYNETDNNEYEEEFHEIKKNYITEDEKKDNLNDIVITQCIMCLAVVVAILLLNIFYPDISRGIIEKYKEYSGGSTDSEMVNSILDKTIQTFIGFTE